MYTWASDPCGGPGSSIGEEGGPSVGHGTKEEAPLFLGVEVVWKEQH